jgi:hypothetical protein
MLFAEATKPHGALLEKKRAWPNELKCRGVLTRRWKLQHCEALQVTQLFDAVHDPQEVDDLLSSSSGEFEEIRERLVEAIQRWGDSAKRLTTKTDRAKSVADELRALGYIE